MTLRNLFAWLGRAGARAAHDPHRDMIAPAAPVQESSAREPLPEPAIDAPDASADRTPFDPEPLSETAVDMPETAADRTPFDPETAPETVIDAPAATPVEHAVDAIAERGGYLAICAIMKNEGIGILEWIAHHRALGVEKFFLYDHGSSDDTVAKILPLRDAGIVELTHWTMRPGQLQAYDDFAHRFGARWTWCAFIDLDEYINPFGIESLPGWLARFESKAGVALQWLNFGPNELDEPPQDLALASYLTRLQDLHVIHGHVKTIVRMACYRQALTPHSFIVEGDVVDEYGLPVVYTGIEYGLQLPQTHAEICINHYYTRSRREWWIKIERGNADSGEIVYNPRSPDWLALYETQAVHRDERILRFAEGARVMLADLKALHPAADGLVAS